MFVKLGWIVEATELKETNLCFSWNSYISLLISLNERICSSLDTV